MRKIFHVLLFVLFVSCNTNKTYKYIEHVNDPDLIGDGYIAKDEDPVIIKASSDEDAYTQAYEKFAISKKVFEEMKKTYGPVKEPVSFQLLNDKNEDISGLFLNDSTEKNIDNIVSGLLNIDSPKTTAFKYSTDCPVKILSSRPTENDYSSYRDIHLSWKNTSKKTIVGIKFKWEGINAFGEPADVGDGMGFSDDKLRPGKTDYGEWSILSRDLKKVTKAWVYEVAFEDGTKWMLDE